MFVTERAHLAGVFEGERCARANGLALDGGVPSLDLAIRLGYDRHHQIIGTQTGRERCIDTAALSNGVRRHQHEPCGDRQRKGSCGRGHGIGRGRKCSRCIRPVCALTIVITVLNYTEFEVWYEQEHGDDDDGDWVEDDTEWMEGNDDDEALDRW